MEQPLSLRGVLADRGLQDQLEVDHPLLQMFAASLRVTNPEQPAVWDMYPAICSRVLCYVQTTLIAANTPLRHWSELLVHPQLMIECLVECVYYNNQSFEITVHFYFEQKLLF